jgi:hypothetical protein
MVPSAIAYGVIVASWILLVAERAGLIWIAITLLATVWSVVQGVALWTKGGVQEGPAGISNRRVFGGTNTWQWANIERFSNRGSRVYVVLKSQRAWPLVGVAQGHRNLWQGGNTLDIVHELNKRLAARRSGRVAYADESPPSR